MAKPGIICLLAFVLLAGCGGGGETPDPTEIDIPGRITDADALLKTAGGTTDNMVQKAVAFRTRTGVGNDIKAAVTGGKYAGVYIYDSKSVKKYKSEPLKLAARLALLGFTDVYLSTTNNALNGTDATALAWLRQFNQKMNDYGIRVHALRLSNTSAYVAATSVYNDADAIKAYNASAIVPAQRFYGASADYEPHVLKQGGADTPAGLTDHWNSDTGYTVGGANDKLLKKTMEILSLAQSELDPLPLSEAISHAYQPKVNEGRLQWGSAAQFLIPCDHILVMCYNNKKDNIWSRVSPVVAATSKAHSVALCVKTSVNTYGDEGQLATSLQPEGWAYLLSSLEYFATKGVNSTPYKGVCFFEFEGLEQMWEWTTDKGN